MKRSLIVLFIAVTFIACNTEDDNLNESFKENISLKEMHEDIQESANRTNQDLLNAFKKTTRVTGDKSSQYPDFYGGSYISPKGKLEILVKGNIEQAKRFVNQNLYVTSDIVYVPCKYSYSELTNIMSKINRYISNTPTFIKKYVVGAALIDGENKVIVYLNNCDVQTINDFRTTISDHPAIVFELANIPRTIEATSYSLDAGGRINFNSNGTSYAFVGFRAKIGKTVGIVTAGHAVKLNEVAYIGGTAVGKCTISKQGGTADAAFVKTYSNCTPTNYLVGSTYVLSTQTSQPGAGTIINLRGSVSGVKDGVIVSTNASDTFNGYSYTNLTTATYTSTNGDSGGIIYTYISSKDIRYTVGIHLGRIGNTRYYSKADNVLSTLGASRY